MLKFGIGVITCKRFEYLKKTLDSLYYYNPLLEELPLVIADDASSSDELDCIEKTWPEATVLHTTKRIGYARNVKALIECAQDIGLDVLYWCTNDMECIRAVDFNGLLDLFKKDDTGQIQFVHWKGRYGELGRERARKNWTTCEQIKQERPFKQGEEILVPANWSWTSYSQMQRLNVGDFVGEAVKKNPKIEKRMVEAEKIMMNNWYNTRLKNYECQNQPFMNQDWKGDNNTGYEDV